MCIHLVLIPRKDITLGNCLREGSHHSLRLMLVSFPGQRSGDGELQSVSSQEVELRRSESRMRSLMRDEVLINVQKFATQVLGLHACKCT